MNKLTIGLVLAFSSFILWMTYLANTGGSSVFFNLIRVLPYGDKLGHFCLFGILTLLINLASHCKSFPVGRFRIYYGTAVVTIFVLTEEISQKFIPNRTFDLMDLTADALGILSFTYFSFLSSKKPMKG
ncbi:trypsin [Shewanella canadensis]|uniref:Trypsin n=2 Tax=Shewanella canadensis TaxID=271096 RepID=A0A431WS02_9GAMM|nr:trypsin [Shewanella canadensis]